MITHMCSRDQGAIKLVHFIRYMVSNFAPFAHCQRKCHGEERIISQPENLTD